MIDHTNSSNEAYRQRSAPGGVRALGVTMLYVLGKVGLPERTVAH